MNIRPDFKDADSYVVEYTDTENGNRVKKLFVNKVSAMEFCRNLVIKQDPTIYGLNKKI